MQHTGRAEPQIVASVYTLQEPRPPCLYMILQDPKQVTSSEGMSLRHLPVQSYKTAFFVFCFFYQIALWAEDSLTGNLDKAKAMGTVGRDSGKEESSEVPWQPESSIELGYWALLWGLIHNCYRHI